MNGELLRNAVYRLFKCFLFAVCYISLSCHSFGTSMPVARVLTSSRILPTIVVDRIVVDQEMHVCVNSDMSLDSGRL